MQACSLSALCHIQASLPCHHHTSPCHDEQRPETVGQRKPSFLYFTGYFLTNEVGTGAADSGLLFWIRYGEYRMRLLMNCHHWVNS